MRQRQNEFFLNPAHRIKVRASDDNVVVTVLFNRKRIGFCFCLCKKKGQLLFNLNLTGFAAAHALRDKHGLNKKARGPQAP